MRNIRQTTFINLVRDREIPQDAFVLVPARDHHYRQAEARVMTVRKKGSELYEDHEGPMEPGEVRITALVFS